MIDAMLAYGLVGLVVFIVIGGQGVLVLKNFINSIKGSDKPHNTTTKDYYEYN